MSGYITMPWRVPTYGHPIQLRGSGHQQEEYYLHI